MPATSKPADAYAGSAIKARGAGQYLPHQPQQRTIFYSYQHKPGGNARYTRANRGRRGETMTQPWPVGSFWLRPAMRVANRETAASRRASARCRSHLLVEPGLRRPPGRPNLPQAVRSNQLREGHDAKLLGATEATRPVVAAVSIDDAVEGLPRQKVPWPVRTGSCRDTWRLRGGENPER